MWATKLSEEKLSLFVKAVPFIGQTGTYSHAYCVHGYEQANLFFYASYWMQFMLCQNRSESGFACGSCAGCEQFLRRHPLYFHPVFPQGTVIPIEAIRNLSQLQHRLESGRLLVIPIYFPFQMKKEAANAFLKLLEEVNSGYVFVLLNPGGRMLLRTISSRVLHIHLPSASSIIPASNPEEKLIWRLCDYNFIAQTEKLKEFLASEKSLPQVLEELFLSDRPVDSIHNHQDDYFENIIFQQLCDPLLNAGRKMAALCFLAGIFMGEYDYLEDFIAETKDCFEQIKHQMENQANIQAAALELQLQGGFMHSFVGRFTTKELNDFFRSFVIRELDNFFFSMTQELEFLFLNDEEIVLPLESFLRTEASNFKKAQVLTLLNSELVNAVQMLYNNLPYEQILEILGLNIIKIIKEW